MKLHRKDDDLDTKHRIDIAFKADKVNDDGTWTGYGSKFGNVDSYGEIVAKGAFAKSLAEIKASGDPLPALWQHRSGEPIGYYDLLTEDDQGLKVAGTLLVNDITRAREAYALMKARAIKGMSIGYYVRDSSWDEKTGIRTLKEVELVEISIVTFPANPAAQIDAFKSKLAKGATKREIEDRLRDSGVSKQEAVAMASIVSEGDDRRDSGAKHDAEVLALLKSFQL